MQKETLHQKEWRLWLAYHLNPTQSRYSEWVKAYCDCVSEMADRAEMTRMSALLAVAKARSIGVDREARDTQEFDTEEETLVTGWVVFP